jgi:hypothetical protein
MKNKKSLKKGYLMMHTACHWGKKILLVIAIIALINMGLLPFGYNLFQTDFMQYTAPWLIAPIHYAAGIAGILLLLMLLRSLTGKGCMSGCGEAGRGGCGCNTTPR